MKRPFKVKIGGKPFTVRETRRPPRVDGDECDGNIDHVRRIIRIDSKLSDEEKVETLLHEMLHDRLPSFKEEAIQLMAEELAEAAFLLLAE